MTQREQPGEGAAVLAIEAGFIAIHEVEAAGVVRKVAEGETGWLTPLSIHTLENVGDKPLRVISIELKHVAGNQR